MLQELKSRLLLQWSCQTQQSFAIWLKTAKHLISLLKLWFVPVVVSTAADSLFKRMQHETPLISKGLRAKALYDLDASMELRKSHESPVIKMLYDEYFGEPNSEKAHHILHTTYTPRSRY